MGKMSKEKGKRGEREISGILNNFGYDAYRGVQYKGSPNSPDVIGLPGIHIEVKRTERLSLYDALAQSKHDSGEDMPVVMHRKNDCEWVVIQPLKDWINLYREWEIERFYNSETVQFKDLIMQMPAAEVDPIRKGKWICVIGTSIHHLDGTGNPIEKNTKIYCCSRCNRKTVIKEKYCPNCGAKMEK